MYAVQNNNNNNKYKEYILETPNQNDIHIVGPIDSILEALMNYIKNNYKMRYSKTTKKVAFVIVVIIVMFYRDFFYLTKKIIHFSYIHQKM